MIKTTRITVLTGSLLLLASLANPVVAAVPASTPACVHQSSLLTRHPYKFKSGGIFKGIKTLKSLRRQAREKGDPNEKSSVLARVALGLFLGSIALTVVAANVEFFFWLCVVALFGSGLLSIIVLFTEKNRKSRRIAAIILVLFASLVLIFLGASAIENAFKNQ